MKKIVLRILLPLSLCVCLLTLVGCLDLFTPNDGNIRFYVDGELYQTVTPAEDGSFTLPAEPTEDGYTFDGWYADATGKTPYADEYKAYGFMRPVTYTLTYHLDGGVSDNPSFYTAQSATFTLNAPQKRGYTFVGWTTSASTTPVYTLTILKGSRGDMTLTAHYTPTVYTITYDLGGGAADNPTTYTIETPDFTLTPPTRTGGTFFAWEKEGALYDSYTVQQGSIGDMTLRAVWNEGLPMLSYTADTTGVPVVSNTSAGGVAPGTRVTVTAPATYGDDTFLYWSCNGRRLSYAASYTFTMGSESCKLVACYATTDAHTYDKSSRTDLRLLTDAPYTPYAVYGGGAGNVTDALFEKGSVTLTSAYLSTLACGYYTYFVDDAAGGAWFTIRVIDTRTPTDVRIVYDSAAYPAVCLTFECTCGGEHTYSLNGAAAVPCKSGDILPHYDKTKDYTLVLCCADGGSAAIMRKGYRASLADYYTTSFTYGGMVYDYVIESEEEYAILYEYLIAVRGVLDYQAGKRSPEYDFYVTDDMAELIYDSDAYEALMTRAFGSKSFPMGPSVQLSYSQSTPCHCSLTVEYPDGLNTQRSPQTTTVLVDTSTLERTDGRGATFKNFPITAYPTVEVRTLYELELLPYGVCPAFADANSDAAVVYAKACEILQTIVDDSMDDYQKVTAIYRYLAHTVTYDSVAYESSHGSVYRSFTSYGALIDRLAVCDGFASAFRLLCHIEDIPCEEYTGRTDPSDPTSGHAWNKYTIDGATYACDVTWARVGDAYVTMQYLMMDEAVLLDTGHYENAAHADAFTERCADGMFDYYERIGTVDGLDLCIDSADEMVAAVALALDGDLTYIEVYTDADEATLRSYLNTLSSTFKRSFSLRMLEQTVIVLLEE